MFEKGLYMKKFRYFDYFSVIKYGVLFLSFVLFNGLEKMVYPYSTAVFIAANYLNAAYLPLSVFYLISFTVSGSFGLLAQAAVTVVFCGIVDLLYKKFKVKKNYGFIFITSLSIIGFVIIGDTSKQILIERRLLTSIIAIVISFFCSGAGFAISEKGLKFKLSFEEKVCVAAVTVFVGLGICNIISPYIWKGITVFLILLCCYLFRFGTGTFISAILGISFAVFFRDINFIAAYLVLGLFANVFCNLSRYVSAITLPISDYLLNIFTGIYGGYLPAEYISVIIGAIIFAAIPNKPLKALKEKMYSFREKQLVRQAINRNRLMLSNRLYELAGVFTEMSSAFTAFKKTAVTEEKAKILIENEAFSSVCKNCKIYSQCKNKESDIKKGVSYMIDVGFAKGKLSLIDLPKELSENCLKPNEILFALNKMLAEYRSYALSVQNLSVGRELIAEEALGVSEMLKGLALESGSLLKYQSRLERELNDNLLKKGIFVSEILIYGENERLSVSMIITTKEISLGGINSVINKTLGIKMTLFEKSNITEDKIYLAFKRSADYDAVFGVANAVKDCSEKSGDTHSVARISDEKFLVALSDGMGSGKRAETVSSVSLSLIESFYKAGMDSSLILNTVNKLLTVNTEDDFTALDIAVIDLKNLSADFIKYGSPYGFILSDGRVRIVEANSLPLGILKDLKPSICKTEINDGDIVLLMTDGIADAFGSSGDIIDFIRVVPALNPQSLADEILRKAIELNGDSKKDDMTVLAVRIFKTAQSA